MWGLAASSIGVNALQSFIGGKSAHKQASTQSALQKAQYYQNQVREYASLTESIKAQGRQNEALVQSEMYNFSNTLSNIGSMELRDAQLKGVMARNKLQYKTDGMTSKASMAAQAGAVGAVGASVQAMQNDVSKKVDVALADLSNQRVVQSYDNKRQQQAMWTNFYQNQQEIDDSVINEAFLPQEMIEIGGGRNVGKFLPHLIGAGLTFGAGHLADQYRLGLSKANAPAPVRGQPQFKEYGSKSKSYAYK